ncbi:hypothetical protein M3147_13895 [Agromyces mediolanus]|nr:hypothetical protein [Agromyces mediolanus]MCM3658343.1 hypothetical protein [Agromyces mediolanus]
MEFADAVLATSTYAADLRRAELVLELRRAAAERDAARRTEARRIRTA